MDKVLALFGSSRSGGNSETLAEIMLQGVPTTRVFLSHLRMEPIEDRRHAPGGFLPSGDDYDLVIRQLLEHRVLLFVTPLYWYGASSSMKLFMDRWSQSLRDSRYDFRGAMKEKECYVVIVGGDNPRIEALPLVMQLKLTFDYVGARFAGYVIGKGNRPGEILEDERAVMEAHWLGGAIGRSLQAAR